MFNDININKKEKLVDMNKENLINYLRIDRISSRNSDTLKNKTSKNFNVFVSKNASFKSLSEIKKSTFSLNNIKPKYINEYLFNEVIENLMKIKKKNNIINKKNNMNSTNKINKVKNQKNNKLKIKNIFINSLNQDNSINKNIENYVSVYKIQNENLSYLFNKSSRDFSDNFKSAKDKFNDLIKRKKIILTKLKLLKKSENEGSFNGVNKQNKNTQTNLYDNKEKLDEKNNIKSNESFNNNFKKGPITNFLNRKKVNNIPLTFPLCFFHKIKYNSASEKNRIENILNKFIFLKTHVISDPLNAQKIIKEFILKNSNINKEELSEEKLDNFLNYLKFTIIISPNKTIKDVINDALNFKDNNQYLKEEIINPKTYMRNNFKYNIINNETQNNIKKIKKSKQILQCSKSFDVDTKMLVDFNNKTFDLKNKKLTSLVQDLENELNEIKNYQLVKYNIINNSTKNLKNKYKKNIFENKDENSKDINMSNICLVSEGISQKYKLLSNYFNNNKKAETKKKSLKKINERMYYNCLKKNLSEEYEIDEIKKKLKLTEYIVLQRAKQAFLLRKKNFDK